MTQSNMGIASWKYLTEWSICIKIILNVHNSFHCSLVITRNFFILRSHGYITSHIDYVQLVFCVFYFFDKKFIRKTISANRKNPLCH